MRGKTSSGLVRRGAGAASIFLALAAALLLPRGLPAQDAATALKATYLVKFTGFVEWPAAAFAAPGSPLVICVTGGDVFGDLLERAAQGQSAGTHPVQIRRLSGPDRNSGCHLLFAAGTPPEVAASLTAVQTEPVLTVTDLPATAPRKGMINFVVQDNRVRFAIDAQAAAQSGLRIGSQLLALAVNAAR